MKLNKEIKIGFLAIIGIMMSVFSYNYLKGINLFEKNRKFKVTYSKVDGLSMSNPVTLNGFKIGKVHKINFNPENTRELIVDIIIENDVIFSFVSINKGNSSVAEPYCNLISISLLQSTNKSYSCVRDVILIPSSSI